MTSASEIDLVITKLPSHDWDAHCSCGWWEVHADFEELMSRVTGHDLTEHMGSAQ